MDKIAVIADIHGNLTALEAVIEDIESRGIDRIFCLGDMIGIGPSAHEVLNIIKDKCEVVIFGNLEKWLAEVDLGKEDREQERQRIIWNRSLLSEEENKYIKSLPMIHDMYISGRLVRFMHSSPDNVFNKTYYIDDETDKIRLFLPTDNTSINKIADVVVYADIHEQLLQNFYHRTLVNIGSVGNAIELVLDEKYNGDSKETTNAMYCIIEGSIGKKENKTSIGFQLVRVPYNIEKELEISSKKNMLEFEEYKEEITKGLYRNLNYLKIKYKQVRQMQGKRYMQ
ncbi:MAG TPA: metallophosphatase family protein [Clostridiales bacterium]|nr:MAG: hypothetical protein A2Y18_06160 [Clostridiales bacterium GWD2_32_19]HCC07013.1 metallophosphatase family protein [Clostridiales bacterium]